MIRAFSNEPLHQLTSTIFYFFEKQNGFVHPGEAIWNACPGMKALHVDLPDFPEEVICVFFLPLLVSTFLFLQCVAYSISC